MDRREDFFRDLCDNAHDLIQSVSAEGKFLYVNRSYRGMGGTNLEEALGTKLDVTCSMAGYQPGSAAITPRRWKGMFGRTFGKFWQFVPCVLHTRQ